MEGEEAPRLAPLLYTDTCHVVLIRVRPVEPSASQGSCACWSQGQTRAFLLGSLSEGWHGSPGIGRDQGSLPAGEKHRSTLRFADGQPYLKPPFALDSSRRFPELTLRDLGRSLEACVLPSC